MKKVLNLLFVLVIILTAGFQFLTTEKINAQTLVLIHDTVNVTTLQKRLADRDSMLRYLPSAISGYVIQTFDSSSTLSMVADNAGTTYNTVIIQETSYDAAATRYLGLTARNNLMNWLNTGTPGNKKALILIGGDIAYNYSRTGSAAKDTAFSQGRCKFIYQSDNGTMTGNYSITGTGLDSANIRQMTNAPAGTGFYPDGVMNNGGTVLYKYTGRVSLSDSVAAVGYSGTNYVVATLFQDPRYFINGDFGPVFSKTVNWVKTRGGVLTGVVNTAILNPEKFELAQNYPNPFNPVTKINFSIPKSGFVTLKVFDILGKEVVTLINEAKNTGVYSVDFNGANLSSGVYTYRLESGSYVETRRMTLIK